MMIVSVTMCHQDQNKICHILILFLIFTLKNLLSLFLGYHHDSDGERLVPFQIVGLKNNFLARCF